MAKLSEIRQQQYVKQRTYTYDECRQIAVRMVKDAVVSTEKSMADKYDTLYTLALTSALSSEPFKFGKKRLCEVLDLFFGQVEGLILGTIDPSELLEIAKLKGVTVQNASGKFEVQINNDK
jgi:hypothetical protein